VRRFSLVQAAEGENPERSNLRIDEKGVVGSGLVPDLPFIWQGARGREGPRAPHPLSGEGQEEGKALGTPPLIWRGAGG